MKAKKDVSKLVDNLNKLGDEIRAINLIYSTIKQKCKSHRSLISEIERNLRSEMLRPMKKSDVVLNKLIFYQYTGKQIDLHGRFDHNFIDRIIDVELDEGQFCDFDGYDLNIADWYVLKD